MEINRSNIIEITKAYNIKADKDYGQNFLIDSNLSKRIVDALDIKEGENVLEIGPGLGSLTHFLLETKGNISCVDLDPMMVFFLNCNYSKTNLKIIENDIRKEDVSYYDKIIANLPYNITTEAVNYLLINAKKAKKMVLMCQQEAFPRFYDEKGKDYGPTSVLLHLLGHSKKVLKAPKGVFYPAPKIDSVVFEIVLDKDINHDIAVETYKLAKFLFLNRRKTIYNNLSNHLKNKELAKSILSALNIEENKRPEEIASEMYLKMVQLIKYYWRFS